MLPSRDACVERAFRKLSLGKARDDATPTGMNVPWSLMPPLPTEVVRLVVPIGAQVRMAHEAWRQNANGIFPHGHIAIRFELPPPAGLTTIRVMGDLLTNQPRIVWPGEHSLKTQLPQERLVAERLRDYYSFQASSDQKAQWSAWTPERLNTQWAYYVDERTPAAQQTHPRTSPTLPAAVDQAGDSAQALAVHALLGMRGGSPTGALFGNKSKDTFQPRNLTLDHTKRTTFDDGANVRARARFRMEGKYPVAWLDDLHSLHPHHFRGKGDQQGLWQLPGGAPYATGTSMHEYVGGVKIWRVEDDTFRIKFYGPRSALPFGGEPEVYAVYAEVPFASATKWNPKTWKLLGSKRHLITFEGHVKKLFPMIMETLLDTSAGLPGMGEEDHRVRAWWAKKPTYPVTVYKQ